MPHSVPLIATIAAAFGLALVLGFIAVRINIPAIVGYLIAGVFIGPFTPGIMADIALTQQLAEIGVMLLMFGVGLHLSLDDLLSVKRIALPGAVLQMTISSLLGVALALWWGWGLGAGLVFGISLSVASTVVVLRALERDGTLHTMSGRIAIGWLIVEDIAMVLVLVLLPPLATVLGASGEVVPTAGDLSLGAEIFRTLGSVALFVALMLVVGRRVFPWLLMQVARTGSRELFTLCVIAAAVGIAYAAGELFGVSYALGAFLAGVMLQSSEFSHRAAEESLPLRDAFSVLFFVSVGMLFDPSILWRQPWHLLGTLGVIMLGNSAVAAALVLFYRYPLNTALTVGASLTQIGEFSFIVAGMGVALGLLPMEGQNLILAGAVLSIALNPLVFRLEDPVRKWILSRSRLARWMERSDDRLSELPHSVPSTALTGHVLIVGYGRVGRRIGDAMRAHGVPIVVAEANREVVDRLRHDGINAVSGNAKDPAVLIQAHVARARVLVIAMPDVVAAEAMITTAQKLRPGIQIVVRTHSDDEASLMRATITVGAVLMGEEELASGMTRAVLAAVEETLC
jgi:CPA2 family monovalent cation:H+ antiporter-2